MMHERDARKKFPFMCKNRETNAKMKSKIVILLFFIFRYDLLFPFFTFFCELWHQQTRKVSYGERDVLYIY
jgi:hypothetical protein